MKTSTFDISLLKPFPVIETKRLVLRNPELADAPAFFFQRSDPKMTKYLDREPFTELQQAEDFIKEKLVDWKNNKAISWALTLKEENNKFIGDIALWRILVRDHRAEIGYGLQPKYWGQGYMMEAAIAILTWGFDTLGLHSIIGDINPENEASRKLLLRLGFEKEGYQRENYYFRGEYLDSEMYGLLVQEFRDKFPRGKD